MQLNALEAAISLNVAPTDRRIVGEEPGKESCHNDSDQRPGAIFVRNNQRHDEGGDEAYDRRDEARSDCSTHDLRLTAAAGKCLAAALRRV